MTNLILQAGKFRNGTAKVFLFSKEQMQRATLTDPLRYRSLTSFFHQLAPLTDSQGNILKLTPRGCIGLGHILGARVHGVQIPLDKPWIEGVWERTA